MAPPTNREEILARLRAHIKDKKPIVGAGAGESSIKIQISIH